MNQCPHHVLSCYETSFVDNFFWLLFFVTLSYKKDIFIKNKFLQSAIFNWSPLNFGSMKSHFNLSAPPSLKFELQNLSYKI